jgi:hypothetical protein
LHQVASAVVVAAAVGASVSVTTAVDVISPTVSAVIELLSPSTAAEDLGKKKDIYEQTFHTADYFCYDPDTEQLLGWRLVGDEYVALQADDQERLWSSALDTWLGTWEGEYLEEPTVWLRLFDADGNLLPTKAEAESQRAGAERQRAEAAEAEIARLRAELDERSR